MCLNTIKIRNRSKTFGENNFQNFWLEVPCGKCAECLELARNQWYLRSYWHSKFTIDNGGFILFDTLTYEDKYLPKISNYLPQLKNSILDYSCFNFVDYKDFLKRLRTNLTRDGYDIKGKLDYFLTSEYGTSDTGTHRPHYHILFYCNCDNLTPTELSKAINKAWGKGRTEGVEWVGENTVLGKNVFGRGYARGDDESLRRVSAYVAKYVTKDSSFQNAIDTRIELLMNRLANEEWKNYWKNKETGTMFTTIKNKYKELHKKVYRLVSQFHRQSQGFGLFGISEENLNLDKIIKEGTMEMPDNKKIIKNIPIPIYYSRKLFCKQIKDEDGNRYWVLNELGRKTKIQRNYTNLSKVTKRLNNWYINADEELKNTIDEYMCEREFSDLAAYMLFYKGRLINENYEIEEAIPTIEEVTEMNNNFNPTDKSNKWTNTEDGIKYLRKMDNRLEDILKTQENEFIWAKNNGGYDFDIEKMEFVNHNEENWKEETFELKTFANLFVIDDYFGDGRFNGFDELLAIYEKALKPEKKDKQNVFDKKEQLQKTYKKLRPNLNF